LLSHSVTQLLFTCRMWYMSKAPVLSLSKSRGAQNFITYHTRSEFPLMEKHLSVGDIYDKP